MSLKLKPKYRILVTEHKIEALLVIEEHNMEGRKRMMKWSSSVWHQPVCLPLFSSVWMPANKAVCVSELSASLPSLPAQPKLHNHSLDRLITPSILSPGLNRGTLGWGWRGKGKATLKKHKEGMCSCFPEGFWIPPPLTAGKQFLLPRPQPPPHAGPCQATEFRKIWDLKRKRAPCIPERAGLPFVSLYSPLFKDTRWRFSDESGKLGGG